MKPLIVAKLANQAAILYREALVACNLNSLKPYLPREWSGNLQAKFSLMELQAEFNGALAAEAECSYGEQLSRLNVRPVLYPSSWLIRSFSHTFWYGIFLH